MSFKVRSADVCIPSKTFNLLASGVPILGIGKPDSDFGKLIDGSGAGCVFLPDREDEITRFVSSCRDNEAVWQGYRDAACHASESFTRANAERLVGQFALEGSNG